MSWRDLKTLLETLATGIVEIPGESIPHALGGMRNPQHTGRFAKFAEIANHLIAYRDRTRREPDPESTPRMHPVAPFESLELPLGHVERDAVEAWLDRGGGSFTGVLPIEQNLLGAGVSEDPARTHPSPVGPAHEPEGASAR